MAGWVYYGIVVSQARDQDATQTTEVLSAIDAMHLQLVNMELGYRGFLITGDDALLAPYTTGYQSYTRSSAQVNDLLQTDTQQLKRLASSIRQSKVGTTVFWSPALRCGECLPAHVTQRTPDSSRTTRRANMRSRILTTQIAAFRTIEIDRSTTRIQQAQAAALNLKVTLIGGSILAVLASLGLFWLLATNIARRVGHVTQVARRMAEGTRTIRCTLPSADDEVGTWRRHSTPWRGSSSSIPLTSKCTQLMPMPPAARQKPPMHRSPNNSRLLTPSIPSSAR